VLSADIEKIYPQMNMDEEDQHYLHIHWRDSPNKKLKDYKLKTVPYGTASADVRFRYKYKNNKWKCFKENLTSLESITIPRSVKSQDKMPVQMPGI